MDIIYVVWYSYMHENITHFSHETLHITLTGGIQ